MKLGLIGNPLRVLKISTIVGQLTTFVKRLGASCNPQFFVGLGGLARFAYEGFAFVAVAHV